MEMLTMHNNNVNSIVIDCQRDAPATLVCGLLTVGSRGTDNTQ